MAALINLTIDGRAVRVPPQTLVIDAAKTVGIEIPAFCYYEGLSLAAACRMCLVEVEKMPKLQTACTLPVAEGMVVRTGTPTVAQARKSMLELLLTNRYGAGESRYSEEKVHTPEKQFSPVVFFDAPRCILCFRCVRVCNEGLGVGALGVVNRGVVSEIAPNAGDHLECDECGACIDICPVGALTSGTYRYQTRPWEMTHTGTICTHCGDGCKTTLGTRNDQIIRGNNRDRSGINGEFLCIKGRYAFDFYDHPERLQSPLLRVNGKLEEVSWATALAAVAQKFTRTLADGGGFGVIGSNHTTNEENFYLQKFAREVLKTNHIDHHRTGDIVTLLDALSGKTSKLATVSDLYERKAILVLGADLALEHPMLSYQIRANYRHHQAHVYVVTAQAVREDKYAVASVRGRDYESLHDKLKAEPELVILFDDTYQGDDLRKLVDFAESLAIPVKFICLLDYANSRGALDMGLTPELLPGYVPSGQPGMHAAEMIAASLDVLWVVGANPLRPNLSRDREGAVPRKAGFLVVQDMFLTETARQADVVLPAASAYEKNGTVTNTSGEVQRLTRAIHTMGAKPDLEIMGFLAREMGAASALGPWIPETVFAEIRRTVRGYEIPMPVMATGGAVQTAPVNGRIPVEHRPALVQSDHNGLFASGTLGRYSKVLNSVLENPLSR
ncbi:MAG: molybdopterin-dependent oxidoreductase [Candidatus Solibacter sp.]|nr:molybdopterin-dependent oxidoreductase [Candidatus Solibacter sp.]